MKTSLLLLAGLLVFNTLAAQEPSVPVAPDAASDNADSPGMEKNKDTLSVDFPDEDLRTILRNVADLFEMNLVIPDTLQGRTSLKLRDVSWRQIFKVILSPIGYTFIEDGNIVKIISQNSLSDEPFITQGLILENVAAMSIEPLLRSLLTPARPAVATVPTNSNQPVVTIPGVAAGSIMVNSLANELIVTDRAETVARMIELAKRLDSEPRQVVIETKFVELNKNQEKELSVSLAGKQTNGSTSSAYNTIGQLLPTGGVIGGQPTLGSVGTLNAVLDAQDFSALLRAFDSLSGTRIVSNPTIVAINGSRSQIDIGTDLQLVTSTQTASSSNGNPTVTYTAGEKIFEGVKVEVTPQITSSKLVSLTLKTEKSNATPFVVGEKPNAQTFYNVNSRKGTLNMILKDGQTAAIGGLMDTRDAKFETKVPVLGDIPLLGNLFKSKVTRKVETNLIIFITASILEPSKTTYLNLATEAQVDELKMTDRDIQGITYKVDAAEKELYAEAMAARKQVQDEELRIKLRKEKDISSKKSQK